MTLLDMASPNCAADTLMPALARAKIGDDERRVRVQPELEPLDDRHRVARLPRDRSSVEAVRVAGELVGVDDHGIAAGYHGCEHAECDTGECRVDVRFVQADPTDRTQQQIDAEVGDAVAKQCGDDEGADGDGQPGERHAFGIEDRDHEDGTDVVDDRQCEQEQLHPRRCAAADEGDDTRDDGDVGRHGDAPAVRRVAAGVEQGVDDSGHDHAAESADDRQRRLFRVAQFALGHLTLDLETGDEEEQHHGQVVDPLLDREVDREVADADHGFGVPQLEIALRER
ncbi:MAG: hypothetical protein R2697_12060 [Ilumatobacteraceae bacterium]